MSEIPRSENSEIRSEEAPEPLPQAISTGPTGAGVGEYLAEIPGDCLSGADFGDQVRVSGGASPLKELRSAFTGAAKP
jgi:hypothetical protein